MDSTTAQIFVRLDVTQDPPTVVQVNVGTNMDCGNDPGIAILTWVTTSNMSESMRGLRGIILSNPKYAWVREFPNMKCFIEQWEGK